MFSCPHKIIIFCHSTQFDCQQLNTTSFWVCMMIFQFSQRCVILFWTTKIMKLLSMIILNQKQHFSLEKKVFSKELRVQIWTETTKILNLLLRLYREKDETTLICGDLTKQLKKQFPSPRTSWNWKKLVFNAYKLVTLSHADGYDADGFDADGFDADLCFVTKSLSDQSLKTLTIQLHVASPPLPYPAIITCQNANFGFTKTSLPQLLWGPTLFRN